LAAAVLNEDVMPVVVMCTGAWFDPQGISVERHGNPNVLKIDIGTSRLT
jgi:biotin/methionine sulfoxide reductase